MARKVVSFPIIITVKIALALTLFILCSCGQLQPSPPTVVSTEPIYTIQQEVYQAMKRGKGSIRISLAKQKLVLLDNAGRTAIETDCSTGIEGRETPTGAFRIKEMIVEKRSNKYGKYVSKQTGEVVVEKSWEVAKAPPGTKYLGTAMPYWMRLTWDGVGIHVGAFPRGHRTSFGCIRMPKEIQPLIYQKSKSGMRVAIAE